MKKVHAVLFAFLMMTMSLAGCLSGDDGGIGETGAVGEAGSSLHLVVTADELPDCNTTLLGQIFFVSGEGAFQVCSTTGWAIVDLSGPAGSDGTNGTDGVNGTDGANGEDGADGTNGTDGLSALAVTTTLSEINSNCPDGGVQIDVGIDYNDNAVLDAVEIAQTTYICDGADGVDGNNGSASPNTMLTSISSPPVMTGCTAGGRVIQQGLDNGDGSGTAQNGILEAGEVDYTTAYCSEYIVTQVSDINSGSGSSDAGGYMSILVGDRIYFDADDGSDGTELWVHDTSTGTTWQDSDINIGSNSSYPGKYMEILVGDTIYFDADDGTDGRELWAKNLKNGSRWQVFDLHLSGSSFPGTNMEILVGDTIYFDATTLFRGTELWAHDTSNHSTWLVANINGAGGSNPGYQNSMYILVGDTIYFIATDGINGYELWAHDTSNHSTWLVADIYSGLTSSTLGMTMEILIGDTIYFDANDGSDGSELWAHNTSNHSTWQVTDINIGSDSSYPGLHMNLLIGDTLYFSANDGSTGHELWAHDTSNHSTWQVDDLNSGSYSSFPGQEMSILVDDTIYFTCSYQGSKSELFAHNTSNGLTWQVTYFGHPLHGSSAGYGLDILFGDVLFFGANGGTRNGDIELWAHDTSNGLTWQVEEINIGDAGGRPGARFGIIVGDTIYFDARNSLGAELWAMTIEHSLTYN